MVTELSPFTSQGMSIRYYQVDIDDDPSNPYFTVSGFDQPFSLVAAQPVESMQSEIARKCTDFITNFLLQSDAELPAGVWPKTNHGYLIVKLDRTGQLIASPEYRIFRSPILIDLAEARVALIAVHDKLKALSEVDSLQLIASEQLISAIMLELMQIGYSIFDRAKETTPKFAEKMTQSS